jgi:hypothetical protein
MVTVAGMRELFTHACNSNKVIMLPFEDDGLRWCEDEGFPLFVSVFPSFLL